MKWLLLIPLLIAVLYIMLALALYTMQRNFIFHPTPQQNHPFTEQILQMPDAATGDQFLKLIVLNPGKANALVYFGGNAESVAVTAVEFSKRFEQHTVYLVNYRGYGGSSGSPTEAGLFADAPLVFDAVAAQHSKVFAMGRSLGSGVVCWLATQRALAGIVLVTPFDSILRLAQMQYPIFPVRWLLKDHFLSSRYAPLIDEPVLAIIASDDHVIPWQSSRRLIAAFNRPIEEKVLDATGHNDIHLHEQYYPALDDFLQQHVQ